MAIVVKIEIHKLYQHTEKMNITLWNCNLTNNIKIFIYIILLCNLYTSSIIKEVS